jgi:hypothetical protein
MEIPRFLWLGATTLTVATLLVLIALEARVEGRHRNDTGIPIQSLVVDSLGHERLYRCTDLGVMVCERALAEGPLAPSRVVARRDVMLVGK